MAVRKGTRAKVPAKTAPSARGGRKKNSGSTVPKGAPTGAGKSWTVLFWLAFVIFILGLFLFNREAILNGIQTVQSEIAARNKAGGSSAPEPVIEPASPSPKPEASTSDSMPATVPAKPPADKTMRQPEPAARTPAQPTVSPRQTPVRELQPPAAVPQAERSTEVIRSTAERSSASELRERTLYFTQVDRGGSILRIKANRKLPVSDSPMTDVIQALIAGPNNDEKQKGLISLIPPDTRILSATVRDGTAYISFSEDFQYNTYGVEGYAGQLRQIVYTVTEFPNVRDVQILIDGRRVDYLGEGIWIGSPLNRESL